jgi:hypothetical protein
MLRGVVVNKLFLLEPKGNLTLGRLDRIRTMGNVATNVNGIVTTDGARSRLKRIGSTKDGTTLLHNVLTLPNGSENGARHHVLKKTGKEGL